MDAAHRIHWNQLALPALFDALARADAEVAVTRALAEDLGGVGDITSAASIPASMRGRAIIVSREDGVLAGLPVAEIIARRAGLTLIAHTHDGARLARATKVATLEGPFATLLAHERTILNFLTLLSGNATHAARFVELVRATRAQVCDTRKTVPGLRTLQKYATRCGGATLHRIGLFDAVLLKDNHIGAFAAGSVHGGFRLWFLPGVPGHSFGRGLSGLFYRALLHPAAGHLGTWRKEWRRCLVLVCRGVSWRHGSDVSCTDVTRTFRDDPVACL